MSARCQGANVSSLANLARSRLTCAQPVDEEDKWKIETSFPALPLHTPLHGQEGTPHGQVVVAEDG